MPLWLGTGMRKGPKKEALMAGRNPYCDLISNQPSIHDYHFELVMGKDSRKMWVTNISQNGTLRVSTTWIVPQSNVRVYPGDTLKIGSSLRDYKLEYRKPDQPTRECYQKQNELEEKSGFMKETEPKDEPLKLWQQSVKRIEELLMELKKEQDLSKPKPVETHNATPKLLTMETNN
ncbi:FHA domain-containing protein [Nymphaea thermarum]|nr:FHA domain-containing protein [Nymphaea thermarum]